MCDENVSKLWQLCKKQAEDILARTREEYSPNGIVDDAHCGGDPAPPPNTESSQAVLDAYTHGLPQILKIMQDQVGPTDQAFFNSRQNIAPQEAALDTKMYQDNAPALAQAGIGAANAAFDNGGSALATKAQGLQRQVDQPWYDARDQAGGKLADLLGGMDPNQLTGAESANVERGLNRTNGANGTLNNPDNNAVLKNAMTFGSALDQKRSNVANAINSATQFLGQGKSGIDTFAQATGQTGTAQFGAPAYNSQGQGQNAFTTGNNAYNQMNAMRLNQNDIQANRRDSLDRINETMASQPIKVSA